MNSLQDSACSPAISPPHYWGDNSQLNECSRWQSRTMGILRFMLEPVDWRELSSKSLRSHCGARAFSRAVIVQGATFSESSQGPDISMSCYSHHVCTLDPPRGLGTVHIWTNISNVSSTLHLVPFLMLYFSCNNNILIWQIKMQFCSSSHF